ncbi:GIY-YIG nuclease family protein [Pseudomonas mangrovi]|uniref:hypothetical protein n=1 Tax=Pseudomonas mangrovi TaxID=2161748 RepID=UPI003899C602
MGKGTGNRAWEHQAQGDGSEKGTLIREILESGHKVIHTIIADNLTEPQALKIEAELISAFWHSQSGRPAHQPRAPEYRDHGKAAQPEYSRRLL